VSETAGLRKNNQTHNITSTAKHERPAPQPAVDANFIVDDIIFEVEVKQQNKSLSAANAEFKVEIENSSKQIISRATPLNSIFHSSSHSVVPIQFPPQCNGII